MTEHYVTLFDSAFLPQGLALYRSMERHCGDFQLWVIAMDAEAGTALRALQLPRMRVLDLAAVETDELREVKPGRTRGEYCWTLTPFTPTIVFAADDSVQRVTYIDADLWFAASPAPLFDELEQSGASVLITEHAYAPEYDQAATSGRFCVQFMPFDRSRSAEVLRWWQERCIEWCFARFEPGRFGDQKYLDDWPTRFPESVHVLEAPEQAQGPWNAVRYPAAAAITYHFHRVRILDRRQVAVGIYRIPRPHVRGLYRPYLADLRWACDQIASLDTALIAQQARLSGWAGFKDRLDFRRRNWRSPTCPYVLRY